MDPFVWLLGIPTDLKFGIWSLGILGQYKFGTHWFGQWGSQHTVSLGSIHLVTGDPSIPQVGDLAIRDPRSPQVLGAIGLAIGNPNTP